MYPVLPQREAQEGQGALLDLGPEGVRQLKEGRSQREQHEQRPKDRVPVSAHGRARAGGGGPAVRYSTVSLELKEPGRRWQRAQTGQAGRRRAGEVGGGGGCF